MNPIRLGVALTAILFICFILLRPQSVEVRGLVLYSEADVEVREFVYDLAEAGVPTTTNPRRLQAERAGLELIVLTRSVLPAIDRRALGFIYADGAMLAGLNVHAGELQTLIFGSTTFRRSASTEPFFSMVHEDITRGCGSTGSFEDGVDGWEVATFILHRAHEVAIARNSCE